MGLRQWYRKRHMRDPVEGTFTVRRTATLDISDGHHTLRLSGVLRGPGMPPEPVTVTEVFAAEAELPEPGTEYPAVIDRARTSVFVVRWPGRSMTELMAQRARDAREERAIRLGLDPSALPEDEPPQGFRDALERAVREATGDLGRLPDGSTPVSVAEADRLLRTGEAATAVISAISFLRVPKKILPSREASLADVALDIRRADGTAYAAIARFGFRTAARRAQIGFAGATVPVRIDPGDPRRVALDRHRLPPLPG
ncbi:hypothetical protein ORV05_26475 [Amycolatopsis cynarae]|uniref:Uncharacterized protein n=1 Tax=Amycolatopsis cynarae TaxID=2995223 RepID=A0ABY7AWT6_9PSEU|nr:hypothetical protein [Amycolatopsis sp. HUAS 11-8]WAL64487.1 hypothetical protein ORV05_26475 [Amycolatopsis sp. HUAS 11-8]